jgi:hypothetical protein
MLRSKRWRIWGALAAAVVAIALAVLLIGLPRWGRPQGPVAVVYMEPVRAGPPPVWRAPEPPPPTPQPVPTFEPTGNRFGSLHETALDRAAWVGGAVVTCDLSRFVTDGEMALVAADQILNPDHPVDPTSRFGQIQENHLRLVVTEPSGEVSVAAVRKGDTSPTTPLRVRWQGAEPGTTVGCTGVWEPPSATLRVRLVDASGAPLAPNKSESAFAGMALIRGCGMILPYVVEPTPLTIEAGTCTLRVERRNSSFPLIVGRSAPVAVRLFPGETLDLTLTAPDEPPLWQPPDLMELQGIAEIAAWAGSAAAAELIDDLVSRVLRGEWDGTLPRGLGAQIDFDEIESGRPDIDEPAATERVGLDAAEALLDRAREIDPDLSDDDIEAMRTELGALRDDRSQ